MATTAFSTTSAATGAGYKLVEKDNGATATPRFVATFEKYVVGGTHQAGFRLNAIGVSQTAAGTARANALAALNNQRQNRWGFDNAAVSKDTQGNALTIDVK